MSAAAPRSVNSMLCAIPSIGETTGSAGRSTIVGSSVSCIVGPLRLNTTPPSLIVPRSLTHPRLPTKPARSGCKARGPFRGPLALPGACLAVDAEKFLDRHDDGAVDLG